MPAPGYTKRRTKWTSDDVIAKIVEWNERFGEPPTLDVDARQGRAQAQQALYELAHDAIAMAGELDA